MSARWRAARGRSAYEFERTAYDRPSDIVTDQVGSEVWKMRNGEQWMMPAVADDPSDEYIAYEVYNSDVQEATAYMGGELDTQYDPTYPGAREDFHAEWEDASEYDRSQYPQASIHDNIDYQIGGQFSLVGNFPYSMGAAATAEVENFDLTGQQVILRRETDMRMMDGPVGTSDANSILALAYMQLTNQYYPNEFSQADMVVSV